MCDNVLKAFLRTMLLVVFNATGAYIISYTLIGTGMTFTRVQLSEMMTLFSKGAYLSSTSLKLI